MMLLLISSSMVLSCNLNVEWQTGWFRDFAVVYLFRVVSTTCSEILQSSLVKKERYGAQN